MSATIITVNFENKVTTLHTANGLFTSPIVTIRQVNTFLRKVNLTWDEVDEVFVIQGNLGGSLANFRFTHEDNEEALNLEET